MDYKLTPRLIFLIGIGIVLISFATSFIYVRYYFTKEIRPVLNQYSTIINMEVLTRNALVRILEEKEVIAKGDINAELSKITDEFEHFLEERKIETEGVND